MKRFIVIVKDNLDSCKETNVETCDGEYFEFYPGKNSVMVLVDETTCKDVYEAFRGQLWDGFFEELCWRGVIELDDDLKPVTRYNPFFDRFEEIK